MALSTTTTDGEVIRAIGPRRGETEILFELPGTPDLAALSLQADGLLADVLPPEFAVRAVHLSQADAGHEAGHSSTAVFLRVTGSLV
jgi:hypothetical protein